MRTPFTAFAAIACLLAGIAGCATKPAANSASGLTNDTGATVIAGPGQDESGSAVPWSAVGPGWALAVYDGSVGDPVIKPGPATLYLTDPLGGRYTLFTWPANAQVPLGLLRDWSADKRRALLWLPPRTDKDGFGTVYQLDLRTGKFTKLPIGKDVEVIGYTRPSGDQLLTEGGLKLETGNGTIELIDLHGKVTQKLWSGFISQSPFSSPDGKAYVVGDNDGLALVSATGKVLRQLSNKGAGAACVPLRWWDAATLLAGCDPGGIDDNGNLQIWLIPASGKPPTALTPVRTQGRGSADWGDYDYVRLTSGDYVEAMGPNCGNHEIARLGPHGEAAVIKVPGATDIKIETATATRLLLLIRGGTCGGLTHPQSLVWLDPKTGAEAPGIPTGKGEAGVIDVLPYHDEGPH